MLGFPQKWDAPLPGLSKLYLQGFIMFPRPPMRNGAEVRARSAAAATQRRNAMFVAAAGPVPLDGGARRLLLSDGRRLGHPCSGTLAFFGTILNFLNCLLGISGCCASVSTASWRRPALPLCWRLLSFCCSLRRTVALCYLRGFLLVGFAAKSLVAGRLSPSTSQPTGALNTCQHSKWTMP